MTARSEAILLEAAQRIAVSLVESADWRAGSCTWNVVLPDRPALEAARPTLKPAYGHLYQGTAGIALFLVELFRLTSDKRLRTVADGALRYAVQQVLEEPRVSFGFYNGRVGIAYALARAAAVTGNEEHREAALRLLQPMPDVPAWDTTYDLIGGSAGSVAPLLAIARWTGTNTLASMSVALGRYLIRTASRWPGGWSWGSQRATHTRDLTGLAHGSSGPGLALFELFAHTGLEEFAFAANRAYDYENQFFDPVEGNWLDLRNHGLDTLLASGAGTDTIREFLEVTARSEPTQRFMSAWCHGAPGIGLARLRAFEITGAAQLRRDAELAVRSTLNGAPANHCLCHGAFGNDAALMMAARVLKQPDLFTVAHDRAVAFAADVVLANRAWRSGVIGGGPDPSLLMGSAGVGYHFLSFVDAAMPSVLLPGYEANPDSRDVVSVVESAERKRLSAEYVDEFFGRTISVITKLAPESTSESLKAAREDCSDLHEFAGKVRDFVRSRMAMGEDHFADASALDFARFEMMDDMSDFTETWTSQIRRPTASELLWDVSRLVLHNGVRIVRQEFDWDGQPGPGPMTRATDPVYHLLQQRGARIHCQRLSQFTARVLAAFSTAATIPEVVAALIDSVTASRRPDLENAVMEVARNGYSHGILDAVEPVTTVITVLRSA